MDSIMIEIDCPPGSTRPQVYFDAICNILKTNSNKTIADLGASLTGQQPISRRFGNWEWIINLVDTNIQYKELIKQIFQNQLTKYHNEGCIRYASW
tara:strand:- start:339 stop:626 length:288 start_codon:yes stop_codon:yes gene_type:complete